LARREAVLAALDERADTLALRLQQPVVVEADPAGERVVGLRVPAQRGDVVVVQLPRVLQQVGLDGAEVRLRRRSRAPGALVPVVVVAAAARGAQRCRRRHRRREPHGSLGPEGTR
jgi:hypothetical protein